MCGTSLRNEIFVNLQLRMQIINIEVNFGYVVIVCVLWSKARFSVFIISFSRHLSLGFEMVQSLTHEPPRQKPGSIPILLKWRMNIAPFKTEFRTCCLWPTKKDSHVHGGMTITQAYHLLTMAYTQ